MVTSHSGAFITHHRPFFHFGLETLELAVKDECVWGTSQSELASDLPPWGVGGWGEGRGFILLGSRVSQCPDKERGFRAPSTCSVSSSLRAHIVRGPWSQTRTLPAFHH